ncbi:hypothetical protein [Pyxidicoccus sp. MSG2]|uniref:hypothetical protein n=1 Tax=Pyxidicoccus sp. MSG2 TaxID=2996790 RepID=UPI002270CBB8|nr:hypothetical protein [Pyxidicoccus sp. MSG2]MCY1014711.1 hypothetical protein [Pyxidicoccus sp. MSG2]
MKRSALVPGGTLAVLLACAGLSGACSDSNVTTGIAGLSGTYDLVLSNDLIFVTSSDDDDLRVLDLSKVPRDFIAAPNPLQALSVPVLERPDALTHDVSYVVLADGAPGAGTADVAGPYVYARSSGSQEISVVAADRARLVEVARLRTGGLVTAFAARAPAGEGAPSVLYYALQTPPAGVTCTASVVMRQELPGPDVLSEETRPAPVPVFCLNPRESAAALLVMPEAGQFVLATRSNTNLPPALPGRTLLLTEAAAGGLASVTRDLSAGFDGAPVRLLATHPQVTRVFDNPATTGVNEEEILTAGQFIYGVLDEAACGAGPQCSGVLAVESATGAHATDLSGAPMLPIIVSGLPTGLAIVPEGNVRLVLTDGTGGTATVPLLGILPSSTGVITLFNASDRRMFDLNPAGASVAVEIRNAAEQVVDRGVANISTVVPVEQTVEYVNPTDSSRRAVRKTLFEGSVISSLYRIVYQGIFPTMASLSRDLSAPALFEVDQPTDPRQQVAVGDIIELAGDDVVCDTDLVVTAVVPTTAGRVRLESATPIPDGCSTLPRFNVRVAGDQPFILLNDSGTLLARDITGETAEYRIPTSYYFHPAGLLTATAEVDDVTNVDPPAWTVPAFPATPPDIVIRVAVPSVAGRLTRGDRFVVTLDSGIRTHTFGVDTTTAGVGLNFYTLPGPVVAAPKSDLAYIAYPSADGILQVNLGLVVDNTLNASALNPFE